MKKIDINQNDKFRVLYSELLPYETPILFSNSGLYRYLTSSTSDNPVIAKLLKYNGYTVPFDYEIIRGNRKFRKLSLMHPGIAWRFADFYQKYNSIILHHCSKSPYSLRAPSKVALQYYSKHYLDENEDQIQDGAIEIEPGLTEPSYSSSFFSYKKFSFLYKFFDSYDFHRLEKKFKFLKRFDISSCFSSVYTHTIAWAIKDKVYAKATSDCDDSFEGIFDKLMRDVNYNETNGIIIGPEISRIFAEIILQKVDCTVHSLLKQENKDCDYHYAVRRYIDDYFVFANDNITLENIYEKFRIALSDFKFNINDSKTSDYVIPFITDVTIAKIELKRFMNDVFECSDDAIIIAKSLEENGSDLKQLLIPKIRYPESSANQNIKNLKCIVKKCSVDYEPVTSYSLSIIRKQITKLSDSRYVITLDPAIEKWIENFFSYVLELVFFLYAMDIRVRTTYLASQIIVSMNKFLIKNSKNIELNQNIRKKIADECALILRTISQKYTNLNGSVESLNLVIALRSLGEQYLLDVERLAKIMNVDLEKPPKEHNFNYFQIIVFLHYIGKRNEYSGIRNILEAYVVSLFEKDRDPFIKAEMVYLFFDILSCPFVSQGTKDTIAASACKFFSGKDSNSMAKIRNLANTVQANNWFTNWEEDIDIEKLLRKKELRTPY